MYFYGSANLPARPKFGSANIRKGEAPDETLISRATVLQPTT